MSLLIYCLIIVCAIKGIIRLNNKYKKSLLSNYQLFKLKKYASNKKVYEDRYQYYITKNQCDYYGRVIDTNGYILFKGWKKK